MKFLLGKKLGMTTLQNAERGALNVTLIDCEPNKIVLIRTPEKDGYSAVQFEAAKTAKRKVRKEFRIDRAGMDTEAVQKELEQFQIGQDLNVSMFQAGDRVFVSGVSKGKGFQGVVKRHGFKGAPRTHGHKHDLRAPGSIGATTPQHVMKGRRMAGRMGGKQATSENLEIVYVDETKNLLAVRGAVPGVNGGIVRVAKI